MKVVHEWLKDYIGDSIPTPEKIGELLTFHAFEIEGVETASDQTVIDVDVLPNRSSDCLCHRGIAREVATLLDTPFAHDPLRDATALPATDKLAVAITDSHACRRFGAALVSGVSVGPSPEWLRTRLEALGQRSINNIVDATNYVMLALGQPLHAYDAAKLAHENGTYNLGVRFARDGERITTLTGDEYNLDPSIQIIVDGADTPIGIAGIKGGAHAEVDEGTTDIILEAANFDPVVTRKASQRLRLQTDASKRFENEPSRELGPYALRDTAELIKKIAGGEIIGSADTYPTPEEHSVVIVSPDRVNALLGLSLTPDEMKSILERIGATVTERDGGFACRAPFARTDLQIEEDYIEEIGRVHGYVHVASVTPEAVPLAEINARHYYSERIRDLLIEKGFSEVITSSFRKKDEVQLQNALASDKSYLRSSLQKNLAEVLEKNAPLLDLLGVDAVRVFEFGTVFHKSDGSVREHMSLAIGVRLKANGPSPKDDAAVQDMVAAIGEMLGVEVNAEIEDGVAEVDFSALLSILPQPTAYEPVVAAEGISYTPFSVYPHMSRDIALWVPEETSAEDVAAVLDEQAGDLRVRTTLFDEFRKDGKVSYAFRLVFQSKEKTLTDDEVNAIMDGVYAAVADKGWDVR